MATVIQVRKYSWSSMLCVETVSINWVRVSSVDSLEQAGEYRRYFYSLNTRYFRSLSCGRIALDRAMWLHTTSSMERVLRYYYVCGASAPVLLIGGAGAPLLLRIMVGQGGSSSNDVIITKVINP
jgi:hypothetical protein